MRMHRRALFLAVIAAAAFSSRAQTVAALVYPDESWSNVDRGSPGWSQQKLEDLGRYLQTVPAGSVVVVERGLVVAQWGDVASA
jgi:hypothetical protein